MGSLVGILKRLQPGVWTPESPGSQSGLFWRLGLGALGLAWAITTVSAYLPTVLHTFTQSKLLIGAIVSIEGAVAILVFPFIGQWSDSARTTWGRRRPYLAAALVPMAIALALVGLLPALWATVIVFMIFALAYYTYETPYRGLYPDLVPEEAFGSSQGAQNAMRGIALGGALVLGGLLLHLWQPLPFVFAAVISATACGLLVLLVREPKLPAITGADHHNDYLAPVNVVRTQPRVRNFLIAQTFWELAFAGMRAFVVLYVTVGLGQSLGVSSSVLAVAAAGYLVAALFVGQLGDRYGLARIAMYSSIVYGVGMLIASLQTTWHFWFYFVIFPVGVAGGAVMTLSWAIFYRVMPAKDRGASVGLGVMTRGVALLAAPLIVGAAIDASGGFLESTQGYAAMWFIIAIPVLVAAEIMRRLVRDGVDGDPKADAAPATDP